MAADGQTSRMKAAAVFAATLDAKSRLEPLSEKEAEALFAAIERSGFRKGHRRWTRGDILRLRRYLLRGKRPRQIGVLMGRTERAIWRVMNILGWTVRMADTGDLPLPPNNLTGLRRRVQLSIVR